MAPSLIMNDTQRMALGTGGSNRIKTALFQVAHRILSGQDLKSAINAPRIHFENDHIDIEPGLAEQVQSALVNACPDHTLWKEPNLYFGGINGIP